MKNHRLLTHTRAALICVLVFFVSHKSQAQTISTIVGNGSGAFSGDGGAATAARINVSWGIVADAAGNIFIGDGNNNRIRKVNPSGIITTYAGTGSATYGGDGGAATAAQLNFPSGVALDTSGNLYISDANNHRVRKINTSGVITTFAGTGTSGFSGDGGPATAARIAYSDGICTDRFGNVFIPDPANHRIRKVNASGTMSTYGGTGTAGYAGDGGQATAALIDYPSDVETDPAGNLYFTDYSRNCVRKISTSGVITTVAGTGTSGSSGDGGPGTAARVNSPTGIDVDNCGNVYISDRGSSKIRKLLPSGTIVSICGTGTASFSGDGGNATAATIDNPHGVCHDANDNILIVDRNNYRVRKITYPTDRAPTFISGASQTLTLCMNSSGVAINSLMSVTDSDVSQTIVWSVYSAPVHGTLGGFNYSATSSGGTIGTGGLSYTPTTGYSGTDTFRIAVTDCLLTDTITIYVTISTTPAPGTITGPSSVCAGATITLADTATGGTWTSSNNALATVSATGVVTGVAAGSLIISYTVTNGCGASSATHAVTVLPLPVAGVISGPSSVCSGQSITLSETVTGGTWSATNTNATVGGTGIVMGVTAGIDTIQYSITNSCGTSVAIYPVTVNALPAAIGGSTFVCAGATTTLTNTVIGGTWTTSNAAIASVTSLTGIVSGVAAGTCTITYNSGVCFTTLTMNIGSTPAPITGPVAVCEGAATTVGTTSTGGSWTTSNTSIATINTTGGITGVIPGTVTISYTYANGCYSSTPFTVNPIPVAITGTTVVCAGGSTITLSDATSGGSWSTSNAAIASVASGTGVVTGVTAGTATITYDRLGCYVTTTVTVNPQAASLITPIGDTTMCPGDFVVLSGPTYATYSYQWYNGVSLIAGATSSYYITYAAGNYRLAIVNAYGCLSSSVPMVVTVNPVTATATAAGSTTFCGGSSVVLNAATGAGLTYQWTQGGVGITGATNASYSAIASGNYSVIVRNAAGCTNASSVIAITVLPAPSTNVTASGALAFCAGDSVRLTADTGTSLTYQWQLAGVDITGATNINYTATTSGNYQVVVTNATPCTATSAAIVVTARALPSATITVTGYTIFCAGGSVLLNATAVAGNTYQWYLGGALVTGATNNTYTATAGGYYKVRVISAAGCINTTSPARLISELTTPIVAAHSSVAHCWGGTTLLSVSTSASSGITYQWQMNGVDIAGATSSSFNAGPTGYYSCVITSVSGACSAGSAWLAVTEWALPNPVITYDGVHLNTGTTFATYQWFRNYALISGATTYQLTPATTGDYSVQVSDVNGCQSVSPLYPLKSLVLDTTGGGDTTHHSGGGSTGVTSVEKDDIQVFPNPARVILNIVASIPLRAVMTTVDGRKILDERDAKTINLNSFANGIYMLLLFDDNGVMVKVEKVVKE